MSMLLSELTRGTPTDSSVHPTLDVLVTGGRDAAVRVWDMRSRANIFTLTGHTSTVAAVKCQGADPQITSGGMDSTIR